MEGWSFSRGSLNPKTHRFRQTNARSGSKADFRVPWRTWSSGKCVKTQAANPTHALDSGLDAALPKPLALGKVCPDATLRFVIPFRAINAGWAAITPCPTASGTLADDL